MAGGSKPRQPDAELNDDEQRELRDIISALKTWLPCIRNRSDMFESSHRELMELTRFLNRAICHGVEDVSDGLAINFDNLLEPLDFQALVGLLDAGRSPNYFRWVRKALRDQAIHRVLRVLALSQQPLATLCLENQNFNFKYLEEYDHDAEMDIFHGISEETTLRVEHFNKAKAQYNRVGRLNNTALGAVKKILREVRRAIEDSEQAWSEIQNDLREIDSDTLEQIDFSDEFAAAFNRSSIEMMEQDYFETAMRRPYLAALHRACAAYVPQRERLFDLYERVKAWNLGHM